MVCRAEIGSSETKCFDNVYLFIFLIEVTSYIENFEAVNIPEKSIDHITLVQKFLWRRFFMFLPDLT